MPLVVRLLIVLELLVLLVVVGWYSSFLATYTAMLFGAAVFFIRNRKEFYVSA